MSTYVTFAPALRQGFQFQATLDNGVIYSVQCWFNVFAQRWYISISTLNGDLVFTAPMIGSSVNVNFPVSLTAGFFETTLLWVPANNWFVIG